MKKRSSILPMNAEPPGTFVRLWIIGAVVGMVLVAACSRESSPELLSEEPVVATVQLQAPTATMTSPATEPPSPTDTPVPPESRNWPEIVLVETISGLKRPVDFADARDGSGRFYVVEQEGLVQLISDGVKSETPFLDIRERVNCCGERGLLGIAFPPDFANTRIFYVNYTTTLPGSLHTRVSRFRLRDDAHLADPDSEEIVLEFFQPWANHNGGQLVFGPDGYLWIGTGDGGSGGDPQDNGQKGATLLGKMLRIDVTTPTEDRYLIPADNPFVGNDEFLDEIWAYGLRNPWRYSFDRETGDLYIADVGQNAWEEVSFQPADSRGGENYGWRFTEGLHCFNPAIGCSTVDLTLPVAVYGRESGQSITGGFVYRGADHPSLQGIYFFADYVSGRIWGLRRDGGHWEARMMLDTRHSVSSFGEDEAGNLYVVDHQGALLQIRAQTAKQ
ncbi:MAG: PQQ-dependent sugar dehydrogenase [Caldilineaceae bacterium]|nr:PQQ-dependent sugar dehydrogenase [Caldilineaceae bacterium]